MITLVVILVFAAVGGGAAYVVNGSLSAQYSPQRAVTDYFAAQDRGDVAGMMSNATFVRGDGSYAQFFTADAVTEMLAIAQNRAISDVKVLSVQAVDELTSTVRISMAWAGNARTRSYSVKRDDARTHDQFYYSWRVQIPFATINVELPVQPGVIELDNMGLPTDAPQTSIIAIEGYHRVTMDATALYDSASQVADALDGTPFVKFDGNLSASALAAARGAVRSAFTNCDASKNWQCMNHTYRAPYKPGWVYYLTMPGYGEVDYTTYAFALRGDPAADIKLTVTTEFGKLAATGSCAVTMTVDGSRKYNFSGTWTAVLTAGGGDFGADVLSDCAQRKG